MKQRLGLAVLVSTMFLSTLACQVSGGGFTGIRGSGNVVEETRDVSGCFWMDVDTVEDLRLAHTQNY